MRYPQTRIDDATETLTGVSFPDPYRWLEEQTDEVRQWQREQAALASAHVREWPQFERLRQLVARFNIERPGREVSLPRYAAGGWFRTRIAPGGSQGQAVVADEPMGAGRVLFDLMTEYPRKPAFLSWIAPAPDGRTLALGVCADGSESNTIRLLDVDSGRSLPEVPQHTLMDNWTGGVQWLPDSSGFFFSAIVGAASNFEQCVYLHRRTPVATTVPVDVEWTEGRASRGLPYRMVLISRDGAHAVAIERLRKPIPVAIAALGDSTPRWRRFVTSIDGTVAGHILGQRYIAVTDVGAPRGRIVAIPLDADDPNDPKQWEELVGESAATLRTVTPVGDLLYLTEFVDTYARVSIVDLHGKRVGEVPLPDRGAINEQSFPMSNLLPKGHPRRFVFGFSSLTTSSGVYSHTPGATQLEVLQEPQVRLENAVVEDRWAVSVDGTRIPYHIVRRADVDSGRPQPTLIWAYGGLNTPLVPQFPGPMAAFVAAGGAFVHAHLRGGAEFGLDWWQSGRMRNKQNCYHDVYAVANDLIASNRATPQLLAVTGASHGGLMSAVAATQRPSLWQVVVPRVPRLDLIGACRDPYSRMSIMGETADVEDPEEVRRLASLSPYHLIRDGTAYPAVFIDAGDTDPRCPPWHARKFAARLQRATAGTGPVLVHVWENVGHGFATDKDLAAMEHAEWLAFTLRHLGVIDWT